MAKKNDALKKHHFWILAGLAPLFVLLAVIFLMTGVSSAISKQAADIKTSVDTVQKTSPPGEGVLKDYAKQKEVLDKKKGELWKENWERQKVFFTWPRDRRGEFAKYRDLKFGEPLKEQISEFEEFTRNYGELYPELAERVKPTKFAGGWPSVLRYVPNWGEVKPKSEQIWLALEDLWVQRAVLEPIKVVNEETAAFEILPETKGTPLKRKFRSRVWDLTLEVADDKSGNKLLKGKLKNRTGQLQLLGLGNKMWLHVWFDNNHAVAPFWFEVQGEFVPGDTEVDIPPVFTHFLGAGSTPTEISKVVQVLDERTAPVRRIDRLVLGYKSSKHVAKELEAPKFWADDPAAAPAAPTGGSGGFPGEGVPGSPDGGRPAGGGPGGFGGPGGVVGGLGGRGGPAAAGGPAAVIDANKRRYLEVTDQVRRMPVALVLVVDQMFIPDVLIAYSNSPFRFYTAQTHWRRFHGSLGTTAPAGSSGGMGMMAGGFPGSMSPPGGFPGEGGRGGLPGLGSPDGGEGEGVGIDGDAGRGLLGLGGGGGYGGMYGYGGGMGSSTVSEAQANAGLVELTLYGVVSLYEKFEEKKDEAAAPPPEEKKDEEKKPAEKKTDEPTGEGKKDDEKKAEEKKDEAAVPDAGKKPDPAAEGKKDGEKKSEEKKPDEPKK